MALTPVKRLDGVSGADGGESRCGLPISADPCYCWKDPDVRPIQDGYVCIVGILLTIAISAGTLPAQETRSTASRPKRVLLLGQKPDSHAATTHEYMAGVRIIARLLQDRQAIQTIVIQADDPWPDGPELLDGADAVVLYLSEGAKWVSADPARLAAFQRLAERGGGFTCLHWGMGTKVAEPIQNFTAMFACACHGGPDRKYKVGDFRVKPIPQSHPILGGATAFDVHDEFYYDLKLTADPEKTSGPCRRSRLRERTIPSPGLGGDLIVVDRLGFSGLHFHENWKRDRISSDCRTRNSLDDEANRSLRMAWTWS